MSQFTTSSNTMTLRSPHTGPVPCTVYSDVVVGDSTGEGTAENLKPCFSSLTLHIDFHVNRTLVCLSLREEIMIKLNMGTLIYIEVLPLGKKW